MIKNIEHNGRCFAVVLMPPKHLLGVSKILTHVRWAIRTDEK